MEHPLPTERNTELAYKPRCVVTYKFVCSELTHEQFQSNGSQPTQDAGKLERRDAADAEHVDWFGVVTEHQRAALHGTPPQALFAERNLPVAESQPGVCIQQLNLIHRTERRRGWNVRETIDSTDELSSRQGLCRCGWRMLVFGSRIRGPTTAGRPCRNATNEVEPFLIRPPEIIGDRLTKMIAIGERLTRDFCHATID